VCCEGGGWMELSQHRVQWQALVFVVMKLRILLPLNAFDFSPKGLEIYILN
jgi:hypothetical protein